MEGKGPYRIYDPGGSEVRAREEAVGGCSYRQLLEENSILRERMKGLKSLGRFRKAKLFLEMEVLSILVFKIYTGVGVGNIILLQCYYSPGENTGFFCIFKQCCQ